MHPQKLYKTFSSLQIRVTFVLVLLLSACFIFGRENGSASSKAQTSSRESVNVPPGQAKQLDTRIPHHLPVSVKVKKLNRKEWAHDLEVAVTNTSGKPIYYLDFQMILPEIKSPSGVRIGFPLRYGRTEFVKFTTPAEPRDVPIQPGETHTFKIPASSANGLDHLRAKENSPEPKKIQIIFQVLNFGDGTGYADAGGTPIDIHKKVSLNKTCAPPQNRSADSLAQPGFSFLSASFMPANFPLVETFKSLRGNPSPRPDINCPGTSCSFVKPGTYICSRVCDPGNDEHPTAVFVGSGDPEGACRILGYTSNACYSGGIPIYCTDTQLYSCSQYGGAENTDSRCSDQADNDGDSLIDCDDPNCSATTPCNYSGPSSCPGNECNSGAGGFDVDWCLYPASGCPQNYDNTGACCQPHNPSPIIVDVDGSGFNLTSASDGVWFDFFGTGAAINISWTARGSTNAWLVLDRDGNGFIDSGKELFGDIAPQPVTANPNGFLALAEYDKAANGGDGDGVMTKKDAIFSSLRLWQDTNHNGVSEPSEMHTLPDLGLKSINLDYKESKRTDRYGNSFRYRAKVKDTHDAQLGRWAWDVFLVAGQ